MFRQKILFKAFWKGKRFKKPSGIQAMTYRFEANPLTPCATLLVFYFGKEIADKITLEYFVDFDKQYVTI